MFKCFLSTLSGRKKGDMKLCLQKEKVDQGRQEKTIFHLNPRCRKYFLKSFEPSGVH